MQGVLFSKMRAVPRADRASVDRERQSFPTSPFAKIQQEYRADLYRDIPCQLPMKMVCRLQSYSTPTILRSGLLFRTCKADSNLDHLCSFPRPRMVFCVCVWVCALHECTLYVSRSVSGIYLAIISKLAVSHTQNAGFHVHLLHSQSVAGAPLGSWETGVI